MIIDLTIFPKNILLELYKTLQTQTRYLSNKSVKSVNTNSS